MQAFDSPGTVEILSIRPQDIGLLPRENWGYGITVFFFMVITITDILFLPVWEMKNMPDPGTY